jgi:3-deoxy-D-manno-octulosonate 8-phosphate phosphatase (KDO 8-P phosphatase)
MDDRLKKIKVLAMDVDGVLTDGKIIYDSEGRETKNFHVQDGLGIVIMRNLGYRTAIISSRASKVSQVRAEDLRIEKTYIGVYPKTKAYEDMVREFGVSHEEVCFVGDDLADLPIFKRAGFAVAVANAVEDIKLNAHYVTVRNGGDGAVREVVDMILKAQGQWQLVLEQTE